MEKTGKEIIKYLSREEIIEINFRLVTHYGGVYFEGDANIANEDSLSYLLHSVKATYFGKKLHLSPFDKASAYAYHVIKNHIFHDGNKRTGMASAIRFLEKNGYSILPNISPDTIENLALRIEKGEISKVSLARWFKGNTQLDIGK